MKKLDKHLSQLRMIFNEVNEVKYHKYFLKRVKISLSSIKKKYPNSILYLIVSLIFCRIIKIIFNKRTRLFA